MDPDLTIVLLGKSGVGKSASGNTILGRAAFRSEISFVASVTKEISVQTGRVFEKQISVVDTPGILESKEQIRSYCQDLLQSNRKCVFLLVFPVGRFTREDQKAVGAAIRVLGDQGLKKSFLLFTHGESLKNKSLKDFICELDDGSHPDVLRRFSEASHLFINGDGDQEQVQDLLLKIEKLRTHQHPDPTAELQRRMVLLGLPGAGKSSSGNTILGSERFRSDCGFNSVNTECVSESESVDGRLLQVVDTPGLTDEVLNPEQLYEEIMKTLLEASPGPHVFIIVVRIRKISAADQRLLELVPKLFGGDASKYTMVLFTHGDELRGRSMDQLIQSNSCVSDLVSMCDGRYCVFDNTQRGRRLQVRELLNKIDEMVAANGGEHYTSEMFRMAETFIREERNRAAQSADSNRPDQSADSNPSGTSVDNNPSGTSGDSNPSGTSFDNNPSGTSADSNPSGTSADRNPSGTSVDNNPSGTSADSNPSGTSVDSNPSGTSVDSNPSGTSVDSNPSGTSVDSNPSGTSVDSNPSGTSVDSNPSGTSVDSNPSGTSADNNPSGTSVDNNPSPESDGTRSAPVERVRKGHTPCLVGLWTGGLIGLVAGAVASGIIGWLMGVGAGVGVGVGVGAGVSAGVSAGVGAGVGHAIHKSKYAKKSDESSRDSENEQLLQSREEGGRRLSEEP